MEWLQGLLPRPPPFFWQIFSLASNISRDTSSPLPFSLYSSRDLTFPSDKFTAVAGKAAIFQEAGETEEAFWRGDEHVGFLESRDCRSISMGNF